MQAFTTRFYSSIPHVVGAILISHIFFVSHIKINRIVLKRSQILNKLMEIFY